MHTNVVRTLTKYQTIGGTTTSVMGITDTADINAPRTRNNTTRKSNNVVGSWSSFDPTSPLNRFRILPMGLMSKNSTLLRRTDRVMSSCKRFEASTVKKKLRNARMMAKKQTAKTSPVTMLIMCEEVCSSTGRLDHFPTAAIVASTQLCVMTNKRSMKSPV